jgi:hypothetical protein
LEEFAVSVSPYQLAVLISCSADHHVMVVITVHANPEFELWISKGLSISPTEVGLMGNRHKVFGG